MTDCISLPTASACAISIENKGKKKKCCKKYKKKGKKQCSGCPRMMAIVDAANGRAAVLN